MEYLNGFSFFDMKWDTGSNGLQKSLDTWSITDFLNFTLARKTTETGQKYIEKQMKI